MPKLKKNVRSKYDSDDAINTEGINLEECSNCGKKVHKNQLSTTWLCNDCVNDITNDFNFDNNY